MENTELAFILWVIAFYILLLRRRMMSEDIKKIHHVEMTFDHTIAFDIQEIANSNNFEIADIAEIECGKWAHLHITLKDGRVITEDGCNYGEVDMKWASAEYFYDENYNEVAQ
jgi:hypothetical protein